MQCNVFEKNLMMTVMEMMLMMEISDMWRDKELIPVEPERGTRIIGPIKKLPIEEDDDKRSFRM